MKSVHWTVKNIADIMKQRQLNEFDSNIAITGQRGDGKSSLIFKLLKKFKGFKPWVHIVYSRDDVIKLLKTQYKGFCFDDEAISTSFKRNFYEKGQIELIKILTAYRDNYNYYTSAVPSFFSLDKELRTLYFLHLHIIQRGIAVVHMPLQGRLYSMDRWDARWNAKVEDSWSKRIKANPNFRPPYHKLTTFRGYLFWKDITKKQAELYKEIKKVKRADSFQTEAEKKGEISFIQRTYNLVVQGKLSKQGLLQACLIEEKKYSTISSTLNQMLQDKGEKGTLKSFLLVSDNNNIHNNDNSQINSIVPEV